MSVHNDPFLEERLRSWNPRLEPDPQLDEKVLRRLGSTSRSPEHALWISRFHLVAYGAMAALVLLGVFMASRQIERSRLLRDGSYFLMIDPVFRAQTVQAPGGLAPAGVSSDTYLDRLAWMQDRLDLSRQQFMELVDLHRNYADRFDSLYRELVALDHEYGQFEELRRRDEAIDFMALYDVLQERRLAEEASHSLSLEFIGRVMALLNNEQRQTYLSLVQPVHG